MYIKKRHIAAILMGLSLVSAAQAEQSSFSTHSQPSHLTQVKVAEQDQASTLNFEFNSDHPKSSFEQVHSADDGDNRINVAMNIGSPRRDELNLSVGALSLEFPEDSNKSIDVDIRPFFYVSIGSHW